MELHRHDLLQTQLPPTGPTPNTTTMGFMNFGGTHSVHTEWVHNLFFSLALGSTLWVLALLSELSFLFHKTWHMFAIE